MIVFLDFDGVLHPFHRPSGALSLRSDMERVLRDFAGIDIVISSTWREMHTIDELRKLFSPDIAQRIIGVTPVFGGFARPYVREAEINAWLRESGREDEDWVALDDTEWFFSPGCSNLILIDGETGFNAHAESELRRRLS